MANSKAAIPTDNATQPVITIIKKAQTKSLEGKGIEEQDVIDRILAHLREKEQEAPARPLLVPPTRAPPATLSLFAGSEFQNPHQQRRH